MNERLTPLNYDEVVARFSIDILKAPADLVVKNGDLATTKSGDLMLNSPDYSAFFRLVQGWRYNAPVLESLFALVAESRQVAQTMDTELSTALMAGAFEPRAASSLNSESAWVGFRDVVEAMDATKVARGVYAGTIVMVLHALLQAFNDDIGATPILWRTCPPLINGCSVGSILEASANNFRHRDEWMKSRPPNVRQLASIRVLAAALGEPMAPDGSGHDLARDVCPEILDLLGSGNFGQLSDKVFAFARAMAQQANGARI